MTALESQDPADQGPPEPRVTGSPESIWLVYGDLEQDDTHEECSRHGDVTWCESAQFSSDVRYVRADLFEKAKASEMRALTKLLGMHKSAKEHRDRVRELEAELERLRLQLQDATGALMRARDDIAGMARDSIALSKTAGAHSVQILQLRAEAAASSRELDRLRPLTFCGCGDQFTAHDPGTCGNCVAAMGNRDA